MEHTLSKEGRRWGSWSETPYPHSISSHLTMLPPQQHVLYAQPSQVLKAASLPLFKASWAHSVSHWYVHLAAVFVPSIGLEDVTAHNLLSKS